MQTDEGQLAAAAGADQQPPASNPPGNRGRTLQGADARLLTANLSADHLVEKVRDFAKTNAEQILAELSEAQRDELKPALENFAAAATELLTEWDLSRRGFAIKKQAANQLGRIARNTDTCNDSPSKILGLVSLLGKPGLNEDAVKSNLAAIFDVAKGKITADSTSESLTVDLETLLREHQLAKRTRATKSDFGQHVGRAVRLVRQGIAHAKERGNYELAYQLFEALNTLEQQVLQFFQLVDMSSFERARDVYMRKGNLVAGMNLSEQSLSIMQDLAANKDYAEIFRQILGSKIPKASSKRAAKAENSNSSSSDGEEDGPPRKNSKGSNSLGALSQLGSTPFCFHCCASGHAQKDCSVYQAELLSAVRKAGPKKRWDKNQKKADKH